MYSVLRTGNATLGCWLAEGEPEALNTDSVVAVASFRRYSDAVRASVRVEAQGVIVGTELTVAIGGRRPVGRAVGYAVLVGAWLGLLLAALGWIDHQPIAPPAAVGAGFGAVAGAALAIVLGREPAGGIRIGRYELRVETEAADRVRAALLRAKGELGDVAVIPASAPGRRAPAYPASQPGTSAEELLGLAPAPRA
jgi:hypothetical protein